MRFIFVSFLFFCSFSVASAQQADQAEKEARALVSLLEKKHFNPPAINDSFSEQLFFRLIDILDPHHLYFTASDIKELSVYKFQIDNELTGDSWKFMPYLTNLYKQKLLKAETTFQSILQKPFNFTVEEKASFYRKDTLNFAKDDREYLLRWNKWLKYETLLHLVDFHTKETTAKPTDFLTKESEARQKVGKTEKRNIKRMLDHPSGYEQYLASIFYYVISTRFDPHSLYLSKTDWENFQAQLSKESLSFGMDIEEDESGNVKISRLIPGGPAWKSNELHKDDILTELKWADKPSVDLSGADLDEVKDLLESSHSEKLEITVKKVSGLTKTVTLMKEKIREDENIVKSFILKGEKKIGYISLPGFYTEWENMSGHGCANDVAKEIIKLKEENIEGLLLDIRNNGGGSLAEGLNLAGIFIDEGALFLLKSRDGKVVTAKDVNRGTIYDGPLLVMVNGRSASASEVLASTLQDYNRALIVGDTTFGKATGQIVVPIDTSISDSKSDLSSLRSSSYGLLTVTIHKLYRITGKSAQLKGVIPDICLPNIYDARKEASYAYALPADTVIKKVYYSPLIPLPTVALTKNSIIRVGANESFQTIKKLNDSRPSFLKDDKLNITLTPDAFKKDFHDLFLWRETMSQAEKKPTRLFTVQNNLYDKELMNMDTYSKEVNTVLINNILSDIYIDESFHILIDLINLTKK